MMNTPDDLSLSSSHCTLLGSNHAMQLLHALLAACKLSEQRPHLGELYASIHEFLLLRVNLCRHACVAVSRSLRLTLESANLKQHFVKSKTMRKLNPTKYQEKTKDNSQQPSLPQAKQTECASQ